MKNTFDNLYEVIADEEDARVCKDIPDEACTNVPGNFFKLLFCQWLTKTGDELASTKLVLPWLLSSLGAPAFFAGLLVPIRESGSLLPQLLMGGWVRGYRLRKTFFVFGSVIQGVSALAMALVAVSLRGVLAGVSIIGLLVVFSLARGLCSVASKDVLGKTIPKSRRGLLNGYSASGAGVITLILGGLLLMPWQQSDRYVALYLIAAGLAWLAAAGLYHVVNEAEGATEGGGNAFKNALQNLNLLTGDRAFRHFVMTRSLLVGSGLCAPYFVLMAGDEPGSAELLHLGYLLIASGLAGFISGPFWGRFADKSSRKLMLICSLLTAFLCAIGAGVEGLSPPIEWVLGLYFVLSIVHQGVRLGRKTYLVDLAGGNKRTDYVSVSNTLIGIVLLLAGGLSAILAQLSVALALTMFAAMALGAAVLVIGLPEVSD